MPGVYNISSPLSPLFRGDEGGREEFSTSDEFKASLDTSADLSFGRDNTPRPPTKLNLPRVFLSFLLQRNEPQTSSSKERERNAA
jgi:hypothetical protein